MRGDKTIREYITNKTTGAVRQLRGSEMRILRRVDLMNKHKKTHYPLSGLTLNQIHDKFFKMIPFNTFVNNKGRLIKEGILIIEPNKTNKGVLVDIWKLNPNYEYNFQIANDKDLEFYIKSNKELTISVNELTLEIDKLKNENIEIREALVDVYEESERKDIKINDLKIEIEQLKEEINKLKFKTTSL